MAESQAPGPAAVEPDAASAQLARNWWAIAVRGVLGVGFGLVAVLRPDTALSLLVYAFAAYVSVDGVFAIISALRASQTHRRWRLLVAEGLVGILAGAAAVVWQGLSAQVFVLLVGSWAIVSGGLMLTAAFSLSFDHGRRWLALGGAVSLLCGALLIAAMLLGALALAWWLGADTLELPFWLGVYALVFGAVLTVLAFTLRARKRGGSRGGA
jgi:uncharacterized membrane protein HdeD (DUF308 family)